MKLIPALLAIASLALTSCNKPQVAVTDPSALRHYVFGLSPLLNEKQREDVWDRLGELVLEKSSPGDEIVVYDAFAIKELARFSIPNETLMMKNPNARARRMAPAFAALKGFLAASMPEADRPGAELIMEPQFLREVSAQNLARPLSVVLVGSPLYNNPRDQNWSFTPARFPSDGHLQAEPIVTPFSTRDRESALEGVKIAHAYFDNGVFETEAYRMAAERFWSLWIAGQKGVLSSFTPDLKTALRDAIQTTARPVMTAEAKPDDDKVQMCALPIKT